MQPPSSRDNRCCRSFDVACLVAWWVYDNAGRLGKNPKKIEKEVKRLQCWHTACDLMTLRWNSLTDDNKNLVFAMLGLNADGDGDLHSFNVCDKFSNNMLRPLARTVFCGACHAQRHLHCVGKCDHFRLECRCFMCWQALSPYDLCAVRWAMVAPRGTGPRRRGKLVGFRLAFQRCGRCPLPPHVQDDIRYRNIVEEGGPGHVLALACRYRRSR